MNFSKTEKLLLGVSLWGLLNLLLLPYVDFGGPAPADAPSFATVIPESGDVRQRASGEFDWKDLSRSAEVAENSRVYTGGRAHARVAFDGGGELELQERTLVVLSRDAQRSRVIEVEQGLVFLDLPQGDIFIRVGGEMRKISGNGARLRLERNGDDVVLTLVSGLARMGDRALTPSVRLSLFGGFERRPGLRLLVPEDGGIAWIGAEVGAVDFAWKQAAPGESIFTLRAADGREVARQASMSGGTRLGSLAAGDYEWEVKSGAETEKARFRLRPVREPRISAVRSRDGALDIAWTDPSVSDAYDVVVADALTGRTAFAASTLDPSLTTPPLPRGTYSVRVTSRKRGRPTEALASKPLSHFHDSDLRPIDERLALKSKSFRLELTWPGARTVTTGFTPVREARVAWSGMHAKNDVQIATDYSFERIVDQFEAEGNEAVWSRARAGQFFVRVRPRTGVPWSDVSSMRVIYAAPAIEGLSRDLSAPQARVAWDSHPGVRRFEVDAADNADFRNAVRVVADARMTSVPLPPEGRTLHVRVRGLSTEGWPVTRFSETATLRPPAAPAPETLPAPKLAEANPPPAQPPALTARVKSSPIEAPFREVYKRLARVWAGLGLNYFRLGQSDNASLDQATFSSFTGPTLMAEISAVFKEFYEIMVGYHDQPGSINNPAYGLTETNSRWQTMMVDVAGRFATVEAFDHPTHLSWHAGVQSHRFPFLSVQNGAVSQSLNAVNNVALGVGAETIIDRRWSTETFLRYQFPVSASSSAGSVKYSPVASFDGSFGIVRRLPGPYLFGFYWFGQSQNMLYDQSGPSGSSAGTQTFFNSNFQLRFGYELEDR